MAGGITAGVTSACQIPIYGLPNIVFDLRWSARRLWKQACGSPPAHACFFYRATLVCVRAIPLSSNVHSTKMKAVKLLTP